MNIRGKKRLSKLVQSLSLGIKKFFGFLRSKNPISSNRHSSLTLRPNKFSKFLAFVRLKLLELRYLPHIEIRLVHDKTYAKGGVYKKWTDKKYSSAIHRAVFIAFIASFIVFSILQTFVPLFNLAKPNVAQAGANTAVWTTSNDFINNTSTTGNATTVTGGKTSNNQVTLSDPTQTSDIRQFNNILYSVEFADDNIGLISYNLAGYIARTTNGGNAWTAVSTGSANQLFDIDCVNSNTCFGVGNTGTILKSTNSGSTWSTLNSGTSQPLMSVKFTDSNTGYAVGNAGVVLKTSDGGSTWDLTTQSSNNLNDIFFVDSSNGYAVGSAGTIIKTSNSGTSWSTLTSGIATDLKTVFFVSTDVGFVAGNGGVALKTTDGGSGWTTLAYGNLNNIESIYFTDANTGFAGEMGTGVRKTTNGGTSWTADTNHTSNTVYDIVFTSSTVGYTVGTSGHIAKTTNGATTWSTITSVAVNTNYKGIYSTDSNTIYICGEAGKIRKSTDAGLTWNTLTTGITTVTFNDLYFTDASTGYAVGTSGKIYKTSNGGTSWSALTTGTANTLYDVYFTDANTGYASGIAGTIIKTTNAGTTWSALPSGTGVNSFWKIYFKDANTGFVVGSNGDIRKTTNAGVSWSVISSGSGATLIDLFFTDTNTAYISGTNGTILKSTNGGANWNALASGTAQNLNSIYFTDTENGYVAGNTGTIRKTTDGGANWTALYASTYNNLLELMFVGSKGFTIGDGSIVTRISSVYPSPATITDLQINPSGKASWSVISWNGTEPANTNIKFRTRGADTEVGLVTADWSGYYDNSGSSITTTESQWLEVELTLESSDGTATPTLNDFTVTYDTLEAPVNSNLVLTKSDSTALKNNSGDTITGGVAGAYTNETGIKVTANNLTCGGGDSGQPACAVSSTNLRPQVQVSTTADTTFATPVADVTATAGTTYANITGLTDGTNYHLRVRAVDDQGRVSGWTSYGANAESAADFSIDQTVPTGTVSIANGAQYATSTSVTLNLDASDTGGSVLAQMRFSNDGIFDAPEEDWSTYAATKAWTLTSGDSPPDKTVYAQFRDNAGNIGGWIQTTDAHFNSGLTKTNVESVDDSLKLTSNTVWLAGRSGSILDGKSVYNRDLTSTDKYSDDSEIGVNYSLWKTDNTYCDTPQCTAAGPVAETDPLYLNKLVLVANNNTDFALSTSPPTYPARDACKFLGGRLPTVAETKEIYQNKSLYGNNFSINSYWTATQNSANLAYNLNMNNGSVATINKNSINNLVRCVNDTPAAQYSSSGTFESSINNAGSTNVAYNTVNFTTNIPGGTSITVSIRGGNTATPDGSWTSYSNISSGGSASALNGKQYLQYKIVMTGGAATPTFTDITFEISPTDTITLDTAPPTAYTLSSPSNPTYSSTEANPTFNWTASTGHSKYQLWIDNELNKDNIDSGSTSTTATAPLSEGSHIWTVKALDAATNTTTATNGPFTYAYDTTAPSDVTNVTAPIGQAGSDYIQVNWDAASDGGSGIKEYTLEYKLIDEVDYTVMSSGVNCNLTSGTTCRIPNLLGGYAYNIRIKVTNNANLSSGYTNIIGYTVDTTDPTLVSNVQVLACTKTGTNCSTADNPNPEAGYELKITWDAAADTGVGIAGYKLYRTLTALPHDVGDFDLVGYFDANGGPQTLEYFDNDDNNDATFNDADLGTVKTIATTHLNDFVSYYYRINAIDKSGNERDLVDPENYLINYGTGKTVDVTNPAVPTDLTPTATGVDNLNNEPPTQAVTITWSDSSDTRTPGRTPTGNGSEIKEYQLQRAIGDINGPTEAFGTIYTGATPSYSDSNMAEDTYYYYKVKATDNADNPSTYCTQEQVRTKNSQVPTTPSAITITAKPGDPNTDPEVGYKLNVSFTGSKIKVAENRIDTYKIYRATTNLSGDAAWTALTPVYEFTNLNIAGEVQDGSRSFTDTVTNDATSYYYKVQAIGFNNANQEVVYSGLSSITPGTPHLGWDITPDADAPDQPQEVAVKDIHGNTSMYRNIVTWQMIATPDRNGTNDFSKYQIYRFETSQGVGTAAVIAEKTDIGDNYHVDGISENVGNVDYSYYVVAVDNAGTDYKYANNTVINPPYNNISGYSGIRAITPSTVRPTVTNPASSGVGVSSANITWDTDQLCDSLVEYRVKDTETVIAAGKDRTEPVTSHTVGLVGLEKGKTYQYRIVSKNSLGNIDSESAATWYEFTTQDFAISNRSVSATTTTATVTWTTNINADSSVEYKPESSAIESSTAGDPALTTNHEVVIKGLKPATTYTYKIRSISADKYVTDTNFATFTTKPFDSNQFTLAPSASNVAEENITATSAKIVWNTAIETDTWVDFGTRAGNYSQSAGDEALNTVHVVELKNLTPGTTYFYRVRGKDANFVEYTSKEYSFTAVLKPEIQGLKIDINTPYSTIITFNTNVDTEASVTYGKDGNFDLKAGNSEFKRNHIITLQNLEDDATYSYFVEVRDKLGNGQRSATASFATPLDKEGPKVENLKIDLLPLGESDEYAQVIISWSTNKPSTTKIEYDEGMISAKYSKSTIEDTSLNSSHTVIIKDLNPSSTYHFRIAGKDKRGNITESDDYNFVTPEKNKSIWQLIVRSLEETFSWVGNVGNFFKNIGKKAQ